MAACARVALIGAGTMGSLHARVISQSNRAELKFVVDPDERLGQGLCNRYGASWLPNIEALPHVDATVVAAATEAHHDLGRHMLSRGVPLLMEKPLTPKLADTEDLLEEAARNDTPIMCGLLERFNPAVMTALSIIDYPRHLTSTRHSPYASRIRTGVSSDLLLHDVDIAIRLAGASPETVRASFGYIHPASEPGSEDVAEALMGFPDGLLANVSASRISQHKIRMLSVAEQDRLVEVDLLRNTVTIYRHVLNEWGPEGTGYRQQTIIEIPVLISTREPLAAQLDAFLDLVSGAGDAAAIRDSIVSSHRVIDHVQRSAIKQPTRVTDRPPHQLDH